MKELVLIFGGIYGALAVLFGAFGAHALKKRFSEELQKSFETGVRYQMYHALILIISGVMGWCFILGVILFSFSIYGLCLTSANGNKWKFLGPITPLGGLLLLIGWILFTINASEIAIYL